MPKAEARTDRLEAVHEKLQAAVESIVTSDDWQRMLKVASRFHNYSFNNQLLIFMQRHDATHVAGFTRWESLGRFVKKGEKGIQIFAPCRYPAENGPSGRASSTAKGKDKDQDGSSISGSAVEVAASTGDQPTTEIIRGFRVVYVFDISQTEGEPLEDLDAMKPKLLDGDAPDGVWDALVVQANAAGFEVIRHRRGSANGYCDFLNKEIAVRPDVTPAQAVKTLIHELGHALLHSEDRSKTVALAEVEVESIAYIVCDALGLDTSDYSFAYIARWSGGEVEFVRNTAERVIGCAKTILQVLSG